MISVCTMFIFIDPQVINDVTGQVKHVEMLCYPFQTSFFFRSLDFCCCTDLRKCSSSLRAWKGKVKVNLSSRSMQGQSQGHLKLTVKYILQIYWILDELIKIFATVQTCSKTFIFVFQTSEVKVTEVTKVTMYIWFGVGMRYMFIGYFSTRNSKIAI